jgi:hypothetical protein
MELHCQRRRNGLWWLSTDKKSSHRATIAAVQKWITKLQWRYGLRPYNVTVFETGGGLHAHIAFIGTAELADRLKASKRFGAIIKVGPVGDRVRLSRDLERDAIDAGYVQDWQRTNARRAPERKPYRPRRLTRRAPRLAGQLPLLPEKPVSRLRDFGGGFVPRSVAREIEFRRRQRGLSQRGLGKLIGRSQGAKPCAII